MRWFALAVLSCVSLGVLGPVFAAENWLVTPEEARQHSDNTVYQVPMATVVGVGPRIEVVKPELLAKVHSPVTIIIFFRPGPNAIPPNMDSLRVTYRTLVDLDITDRVRGYVRGNTLEISGAKLPNGRHRFRVSIADGEGNVSTRDVAVTVTDG